MPKNSQTDNQVNPADRCDPADFFVSPVTIKEEDMEKELFDLKMDKSSFSIISLSDSSDDKYCWFGKKPVERLKHIEILRRINYGHSAASRLQRIFEITERP